MKIIQILKKLTRTPLGYWKRLSCVGFASHSGKFRYRTIAPRKMQICSSSHNHKYHQPIYVHWSLS